MSTRLIISQQGDGTLKDFPCFSCTSGCSVDCVPLSLISKSGPHVMEFESLISESGPHVMEFDSGNWISNDNPESNNSHSKHRSPLLRLNRAAIHTPLSHMFILLRTVC